MRIPKTPKDPNKTHYLTDWYAKDVFKLDLVPFSNTDEDAYYKFYDMEPMKIKGKMCQNDNFNYGCN